MKKTIDELRLIFRGIGVLHHMSPWNLAAKILRSFCDAASKYISLFFSAFIIDILVTGEKMGYICSAVLVAILSNLLLTLISKWMDRINYVKWSQFYERYNMSIGEKVMSLKYEDIESRNTHILIKNLDDAMRIGNYGLIKLHSRIPLLLENFFGVLFSIGLTISVITAKGNQAESFLQEFVFGWQANILLIAAIVLVAVSSINSNTRISKMSYDLLGGISKLNRIFDYYLTQYLDGHKAGKDIRLYRQYQVIEQEICSFAEESGGIVKQLNRGIFSSMMFFHTAQLILVFYTYLYTALKSLGGGFEVGSILKYSGGILQFSVAFSGMMDAFSQLKENNRYLRDYFRFIDLDVDENLGIPALPADREQGDIIEFRSVSFQYPGTNTWALRNVNFTLQANQKTAIVGTNGSGKTTLVKLLCRLYDPTEGQITWNGVDIREFEKTSYLSMFGVVFQDFNLFSFSIGENVAVSTEYDEEEVRRVLTLAGFSERLNKLPHGLKTSLYHDFDSEGVEISGGEAQKIAFARVLYRNSPWVILDEPTAALDPIAEAEIYDLFNTASVGRNVVFISHRLSSCKFCDRILVFEQGKLVEEGCHETLLSKTCGRYSSMWNAQAQYYQD